ncbi:MAG: hypothetical protein AAGG01_06015 [Planctomycetota bacterium]
MAVAILLLGGLGAWFVLGSQPAADPAQMIQPATADGAAGKEPPPGMMRQADLVALEAAGPRTMGNLETRPAGGYEPFEKVFGDSGGTIIGEVRVEGAEYPEVFTILLEPSRIAEGREAAVTRTLTSEPGMRTFEIRDLPLASYRLSASAPGLATPKVEVQLFRVAERPNQRGLDFLNVDLTLRPMAAVTGVVRTSSGDAASDLALYLTPFTPPGGDRVQPAEVGALTRLETRTTIAGTYRFEGVAPGPWMLHIGDPIKPLQPPTPVGMRSKDVQVNDLDLPPLATLDLIVLDHLARPCPDVKITGYLKGAGTGSFSAKTDSVGRLEVPYLQPGPWRIDAHDEQLDQKGRADFLLTHEGKASGLPDEIHIR